MKYMPNCKFVVSPGRMGARVDRVLDIERNQRKDEVLQQMQESSDSRPNMMHQ